MYYIFVLKKNIYYGAKRFLKEFPAEHWLLSGRFLQIYLKDIQQ